MLGVLGVRHGPWLPGAGACGRGRPVQTGRDDDSHEHHQIEREAGRKRAVDDRRVLQGEPGQWNAGDPAVHVQVAAEGEHRRHHRQRSEQGHKRIAP
ncbi:hypothetical protein [Parafrankia sp. EUN1f]|uniref:hypothetical protein n=1 Tax=Parafrankia sp. EUN1f TaxID=102897 RepID=UPI001E444365|nr:hypothetical protein [Parafrankia sp. EUN1f]